jgi:zinc protease
MTRRTEPPYTADLPVYSLPPVVSRTLANGLEVLLVEDSRFPMVTARLGFHAGSKFDPPELLGLSESTAALLTEGTETRTARQIAEQAARMGGSIHADSSSDSLVMAASGLAENLPRVLELMADVARRAIFPEDEVALRKQNRLQELLAQRSEASFLADEKFCQVVFETHPYARQDPTPESIERLTRADAVRFRTSLVAPNNALLVLLGALPDREAAFDVIERAFGDWARADLPAAPAPPVAVASRRIVLVDRPGSVQTDIRIGGPALTRSDPDYYSLLLANSILGGGASSRIFMNIREKRGFAYEARSSLNPLRDAGSFAVVTEVRDEVVEAAIGAALAELDSITTTDVSPDELSTSQNYLSGTFVIRLETQDGLAGQLAAVRLMGLPVAYLEQYTGRVRSVTPETIRAAAAKYLDPGPAAIVAVGDQNRILKQLESFGKVMVEKAQ